MQRRKIVALLPLPRPEDASLSPPVMPWEIGLFGRGLEGQEISLSDQRGPLFDYVLCLSISLRRARNAVGRGDCILITLRTAS